MMDTISRRQALQLSSLVPTIKAEDTKIDEDAYKICLVRGHVAIVEGNLHIHTSNANFVTIPDVPETKYQKIVEGQWKQCFYCHKLFRFVTTLEEK